MSVGEGICIVVAILLLLAMMVRVIGRSYVVEVGEVVVVVVVFLNPNCTLTGQVTGVLPPPPSQLTR